MFSDGLFTAGRLRYTFGEPTSSATPRFLAARLPVEFGGGQFFHEIVAVNIRVMLRLVVPMAAQGLQRGAAGGFVAAVFVCDRQVVAGAHLFGDKHEAVAGVQILLLDLRGLCVFFSTVGRLKTLFAIFCCSFRTGSGEPVIVVGKMGVEAAIFRADFLCGFRGGYADFVTAESKMYFTTLVIAVNIIFQTASKIAQIASGADRADGKIFAIRGKAAAFKGLVFEHIFL